VETLSSVVVVADGAAVAAVVAVAAGAAAGGGAVSFVSPFRASLVFVFLLSFHELLDFFAILSTCFLL